VSHISTDHDVHETVRGEASFRRSRTLTIAILIVLVGAFAGLNFFQGPKLSSGRIDTSRAVAQPGQQLRLFANQAITPVKSRQVTITPATPFTVSGSGDVIAIQFSRQLAYGTRYSVRVDGVVNGAQPQPATFRYSFTTAEASVYYLRRADPAAGTDQLDSIMRTGLHGGRDTVLYSARHIDQFAVFPAAFAVSTLNDDHTSSLSLVSRSDTSIIEQLLLPAPATVGQLAASPETGILGLVFTAQGAESTDEGTLMTVDLTGAHTFAPVLDLGSKPLTVSSWHFLGTTSSIVAQATNQGVFLIDRAKPGRPVPLGTFADLGRSSADGTTIVVADAVSRIAYSLKSGKQARLPALPVAGVPAFGGDLQLIGSGPSRVQSVAVVDQLDARIYHSYLVYDTGATTRILYEVKKNQSLEGFSVSRNGQYLAINVIPDYGASVSDGYYHDPQSTTITTVFIDIANASTVRVVDGFSEIW
jgi:hypothetical protein